MAQKLVLSLLLTLVVQTLTLTAIAKHTTPATPTGVTVKPEISNYIKHMARVRQINLIKEFNQTKHSSFQNLQNKEIDFVSQGVRQIWTNNSTAQAVETFKIIVENNHYLYPKLRTYKSFDWLVKFIRQVNVGKSVLTKDSTVYICLMAMYNPCMAEVGNNKIAKILQKFECSYRFYTGCKYDDYRMANPELRLLDFNAFSE